MSPPKDTVWKLEPHTIGKHLVLRAYLNAWIPILSKWNQRILFIDAFAGPGVYEKGEDGSPVIALKALIEHPFKNKITAEIIFLFIEKDEERAKNLEVIIDKLKPLLPSNAVVQVINGTFDETMTKVLDQIEEQNRLLAPSFVMIDPFGISGTPLSMIKRILKNPKTEVYVSFMYRDINRFLETPEFEQHLDQLYGCGAWRKANEIEDSNARKQYLSELYKDQLRNAGARHVLSFDLHNEYAHIYSIFFGTQNLLGCDKMKTAIWKIEPSGTFRFVGSNQLKFDINNPDFKPLKKALQDEFIDKGKVRINEVIKFIQSDKTDYHSGQLKKVLRQMEDKEEIEVDKSSRKKKGTYPDGTILRFLKKE